MILKKIILQEVINKIIQKPLILNYKLYKGTIVEFGLSQKLTKFNIFEILYSLRSKKQRSHEIQVRAGGMLSYQYMGKILRIKKPFKDKLSLSIILRNVVDLISFEINIKIYSPLVTKMNIKFAEKYLQGFPRSNSFFLRKKSPVASRSAFIYVNNKKNEENDKQYL